LKDHIRQGDIFQAVLSDRFFVRTQASAEQIFAELREISPAPYSFFLPLGDCVYGGASPEMLIQVEGNQVRTRPIAGTRPRGRTLAEDQKQIRNLQRSSKEAAEHLMLVDLARNDLGRVAAPGTVQVRSYRKLQRLSNVTHLVSDVEATLAPEKSALQALCAAFPAGTLSGAPKIRAMEIIAELEPQQREFYGGAVVLFDGQGGLESCIAIRSFQFHQGQVVLQAGAGVVADSTSEREYAEIHHKMRPLTQAIAAAERAL